jgi:NADH-quinone oxidoreductase subunit E
VSALSDHLMEEIRALPPQFPDVRTAVMPALDLAQEEIGHLTPEAMSEVATALNLDPGYVEGVATFYTLFHTSPVGRHRLYLCTNISCKLRGADELLEHTMKAIGVEDFDAVSADGLFSVEAVECLGACEYAPVLRLDRAYHHDLTMEKIDALISQRRAPQPAVPAVQTAPAPPRGAQARKPRTPRKKKPDA